MNSTRAVDVRIQAVSPEFNSFAEIPTENKVNERRRIFFIIDAPLITGHLR